MSMIGRWTTAALAAALVGGPVLASGVGIYEQGARASGQGGASDAGAARARGRAAGVAAPSGGTSGAGWGAPDVPPGEGYAT